MTNKNFPFEIEEDPGLKEGEIIAKKRIEKKTKSPFKISVAILFCLYFVLVASDPSKWRFLFVLDSVVHEVGHFMLSPLGESASVAGGTILQLFLPALFAFFLLKAQFFYSASLLFFWFGENFFYISVYISDAAKMDVPLLVGRAHDWNCALSDLNLLAYSYQFASLFYVLGILVVGFAAYFSFKNANIIKEWN